MKISESPSSWPSCLWCDEPVRPDEQPESEDRPIHRECQMRLAVGSVGHLLHWCDCYGGEWGDPLTLSKREAAIAACMIRFALADGCTVEALRLDARLWFEQPYIPAC